MAHIIDHEPTKHQQTPTGNRNEVLNIFSSAPQIIISAGNPASHRTSICDSRSSTFKGRNPAPTPFRDGGWLRQNRHAVHVLKPHLLCRHIWITSDTSEPDSRRSTERTLCQVDGDATPYVRYAIEMHNLLQGPKKWFAKCDKHYLSRFRQTSLATAVTNFTKPRTSHFFDLCILRK